MKSWIEAKSSSDELSLAEDCESLKSVRSSNANYDIPTPVLSDYRMPLFTKPSGEVILLLTDLYLPSKRPRNDLNIVKKDFDYIRKSRNYKIQLQEFYNELQSIEYESVSDSLVTNTDKYLQKYLNRLNKGLSVKNNNNFKIVSQKNRVFLDKLELIDSFIGKKIRKKSDFKPVVFNKTLPKVKEVFEIPKNSFHEYSDQFDRSFASLSSKSSKIAFKLSALGPGRLKIDPGLNKNPYAMDSGPHWGEAITLKKNFFNTSPAQYFLKFPTEKPEKSTFFNRILGTGQLEEFIFMNKNEEKKEMYRSILLKPFFIPILTEQYNEVADDVSVSDSISSVKDLENNNDCEIALETLLNHAKCAYKYHLHKKTWTNEELSSFHRPKISILNEFSVEINREYPKGSDYRLDSFSYTNFNKVSDLSLKTGDFIITEYIEKYPILLNNIGMASKVRCYYTDTSTKINYMGDIGINQSMQTYPSIRSLKQGEGLAMIETNLFNAPIFSHTNNYLDFILIRSDNCYWTRPMKKFYVIGQQEPKVEVPGPKSKTHREMQDKHVESIIYQALVKNNNNISLQELSKITKNMHKKPLKKILISMNINFNDETCNSEVPLDQKVLNNFITPEDFCSYESLVFGKHRLKQLGISINSTEKLSQAVSTILAEFKDRKIRYLAGLIEDNVISSPWNLSYSYLKGRKRLNLQINGRADPTCGNCGYSYELINKYPKDQHKYAETLIRKVLQKEIKILGENQTYYYDDQSDLEEVYFDIPQEEIVKKAKEDDIDEQECLKNLIDYLPKLDTSDQSKNFKVLKRTTTYPTLSRSFIKKIEFITNQQEINNCFLKKPQIVPKIFINKPKISQEELLKRAQELQEKKQKKLLESQKRKAEKKLEKEKNKLLEQQEWKKICLDKYNSGAVLFNTGTNSNLRCSRCNMIGHRKVNKKLCPAYIEETPDPADTEISSKITLNLDEIQQKAPVKVPKRKKSKKTVKAALLGPQTKSKPRREIDEFEQGLVKLIDIIKDKDILNSPNGLIKMLSQSEAGYKWSLEEFEKRLQDLFEDDYENYSILVEDIKEKIEYKNTPIVQKKQKQKPRPKIEVIEDGDTLIINTI
jgi:Protein of unknown function (DUF3591)